MAVPQIGTDVAFERVNRENTDVSTSGCIDDSALKSSRLLAFYLQIQKEIHIQWYKTVARARRF